MEDWLGITKIATDLLGRAENVQYPDGKTVSYTYGKAGERTSITYPDGRTVSYGFDEQVRLSELRDGDQVITYGYDSAGRLAEKYFPNGLHTDYKYDSKGQIKELVHKDREGVLDKYIYQYDLLGNKTGIEKQRRGLEEESGSYLYGYDALGRLNEVVKDGNALRGYQYDAFGNRTRLMEQGKTTTYAYNTMNQLLSRVDADVEETYAYDKRGNLSQIAANGQIKNQYLYGALNRLEQAINGKGEAAKYQYNGLGHRVGKEIGKENFQTINDGLDPIKQLHNQTVSPEKQIQYTIDFTKEYHNLLQKEEDSHAQTFLWDGNVVGMLEGERGSARYYLQDELGSPIRLIGVDGELTNSYGYDEFGQDLYGNQGKVQPFGYTGYQRDGITGTYFAQSREYNSGLSRFNGKDNDFFIKPKKVVSLNLYLYCNVNPLKYIDLDGQDCYVFYLPEWEVEALDDQKRLMKQYGLNRKEVHLVPVNNNEDLSSAWNSMGTEGDNVVDIQTVVINTHANSSVLGFGGNSDDRFTATEIQQLDNKDIENLILYGCNAGHADYVGTNPASQFSMKTGGAPVVASDGTVYSHRPFKFLFWYFGKMEYESRADDSFRNQLVDGDRDNLGWLVYTYDGEEVNISESGEKRLTLRNLINCID